MSGALTALGGIASLVSFVCWIMTVVKMFQDKEDGGVGKGIGGIVCGLYALVWGFQTKDKHNRAQLMMVWAGAVGVQIIANAAAGALA